MDQKRTMHWHSTRTNQWGQPREIDTVDLIMKHGVIYKNKLN